MTALFVFYTYSRFKAIETKSKSIVYPMCIMKRLLIALVFSFFLILASYIASVESLASKKSDNYHHLNCTDTIKAIAQSNGPQKSDSHMTGIDSMSIGSLLTVQEVRQLIRLHNKARRDVYIAPVTWSKKLAIYAQKWANHLASKNCKLRHRPDSGKWKQEYGENLFMGTASYYGVADAVKSWESEKTYYHGQTITLAHLYNSGHYTQIVWKHTKQIGCAKVECNSNIIVVCNYDPPGNILGQKPY